jgi:4-hydroxybenzoate polyprenyltransferase
MFGTAFLMRGATVDDVCDLKLDVQVERIRDRLIAVCKQGRYSFVKGCVSPQISRAS